MKDTESYVNKAELKRKVRAWLKYKQSSKQVTDGLLGLIEKLPVTIKGQLETTLLESNWISVKDRMPETSGRYFVYTENIAGYKPLKNREFIAEFFGGDWIFTGWENNRVTHWMSLPEPPKEDAE